MWFKMKNFLKYLVLQLICGAAYYAIEMVYKGRSHFSMFIFGGIVFILIGLINEKFTFKIPLWKQCDIEILIIITIKFITGLIFNVWLGLGIWNYEFLDIMGQISLSFYGSVVFSHSQYYSLMIFCIGNYLVRENIMSYFNI